MEQTKDPWLGLIVFVSFAGMAFSYYLFHQSVESFVRSSSSMDIGYMAEVGDLVEKKSKDRLLWFSVEDGQVVFEGDTLRSSKEGYASIFIDKASLRVDLEPDSLLQLNLDPEKLDLELLSGGLSFDSAFVSSSASAVRSNIKIGDELVDVTKTQSQGFVAKKGSSAVVSLRSGLVETNSGLSISAGEGIRISGGRASRLTNLLKIKSPVGGKVYLARRGSAAKVPVSLENRSEAEVFLGTSPLVLTRAELVGDDLSKFLELSPGTYYFRAKAGDAESRLTRFSVTELVEPLGLMPLPGSTEYRDPKEEAELRFEWLSGNLPSQELIIARDAELSQIVTKVDITGRRVHREEFGQDGSYFWAVRGYSEEKSVTSEANNFTVKTYPALQVPRLNIEIPPVIRKWRLDRYGVALSWNTSAYEDGAEFWLTNIDGGEPKRSIISDRSYVNLRSLVPKEGNYELRLRSLRGQKKSPFSETVRFSVETNAETSFNIQSGQTLQTYFDDPLSIEWNQTEIEGGTYDVLVESLSSGQTSGGDIAGFEQGKKGWKGLKTNKISGLRLATGSYRIRVKEYTNEDVTVNSPKYLPFNVVYDRLSPPPTLSRQYQSRELRARRDGSIYLSFDHKAFVEKISYELYSDKGKLLDQKMTSNSFYEAKNLLPGKHTLKVASVNSAGEIGDRSEIVFEVPSLNDLRKPKIKGIKLRK